MNSQGPPRRRLRRAALGLAALGLFAAVWAFFIEPDRITVRHQRICLPGWPRALEKFRVAALSDLHVGAPFAGLDKLRRIVRETNRARPRLVVLLGDFVIRGVWGGHFVEPGPIARELQLFEAPLGAIAVLGNHDWWHDGPGVRGSLEAAGIRVLENQAARLSWNRQDLWILGLADIWTRKPDPVTPLLGVPAGAPILALTHNPDIFPKVPARVSLTLAGHTHGGQVYLPLLGRLVVPSEYGQRYAIGAIEEGGRHLFVTPGLGTSVLPVRFLVPPEISVLELSACSSP